ncbi:MAG: hypothetical protein ABWY33_03480 [Cellulomonas sp.]
MDAKTRTVINGATALGVALAVSACGGGGGNAPATFTERAELPSCGEVRPDQGTGVDDDAWACLDHAATGDGAELVVTALSTEGDPITTYYRVGPGIDGVEVFVDSTQDGWGVQGWNHQVCPDTVTAAEPLGCADV